MRGDPLLKWADFWLGAPLCTALGWSARLRDDDASLPEGPSRILVVKLAAVGDTVLVHPALRALRRRYPKARLTWIASPINGSPAELIGIADELRIFRPTDWRALGAFLRRLREERYELAIDFDQWSRLTALLVAWSNAPIRIGYDTRGQHRGWVFNRPYLPPPETHELEHFLALARLAGAPTEEASIRVTLPAAARDFALTRLGGGAGARVTLHPGCGGAGVPRQWPPERFAAVGDFAAQQLGAQVFLTGSPEERPLAEDLAGRMSAPATVLCEPFTFAQFAAILESMQAVVCGNTGAMHIAASVGTPTIAIHGPTSPLRWGPVGNGHRILQSPLPCSPCLNLGFEYGCRPHPCMRTIEVDEVCTALRELLNSPARARS